MLRLLLGNVQFADNAMASSLSSTQTAALLYRSGHKRAAKELLCEQREAYNTFRNNGAPCTVRANWELKDTLSLRPTANAATASSNFNPGAYRNRADCLTAAYTARVSLSACDGR